MLAVYAAPGSIRYKNQSDSGRCPKCHSPAIPPLADANEHMFKILPPWGVCSIIWFTESFVMRNGAVRLTASTRSHKSFSRAPTGSNLSMMPALFTRQCKRPWDRSKSANRFSTAAESVIFAATVCNLPLEPSSCWHCSSKAVLWSHTMTVAPASRKAETIALPVAQWMDYQQRSRTRERIALTKTTRTASN